MQVPNKRWHTILLDLAPRDLERMDNYFERSAIRVTAPEHQYILDEQYSRGRKGRHWHHLGRWKGRWMDHLGSVPSR